MRTFDLRDVTILLGTQRIQGFGDGDAMTLNPGGDDWEFTVGSDGEIVASRLRNIGEITLTIKYGLPAAAVLSALSLLDRSTGVGVLPFGAIDTRGGLIAAAAGVRIKTRPTPTLGRSPSDLTWVLAAKDLEYEFGPLGEEGPPF